MSFDTQRGTTRENKVNSQYQQERQAKQEAQGSNITKNFEFKPQKERIEQILQRPRSHEYLAAMDMIDFISSDDETIIERLRSNLGDDFVEELEEMTDDEIFEMITKSFRDEFAVLETNLDDNLIAVISKCYIEGCDCHAIDKEGTILEHFEKDKHIDEDLERGRAIFREKNYQCQCVEIYKTCCRVISYEGDVEVVKNKALEGK